MAKRLIGLWLALLGLLIFRLYFALEYYHVDIWSNAGWGQWIAENGAKGFFYNNVWTYSWPTQLPLINLVYGWCHDLSRYLLIDLIRLGNLGIKLEFGDLMGSYRGFVEWIGQDVSAEIPFTRVFLLSIKLVPIVADFVIAGVIWLIAKNNIQKTKNKQYTKNKKQITKTWVLPIIYLISPFSWYTSAFWGQYDQISFLFLLLSILTIKEWRILSPILMSMSLGIKPTSAIFVPFYLYLLWEERKYWKEYIWGGIIGLGMNLYWVSLFSMETNLWKFVTGKLANAVLFKSEARVTVNSYNLWHLFVGDTAKNPNEIFLMLPYKVWGWLGIGVVNWAGWRMYKKKASIWLVLAIIGVGSWLVGMNMLERYLFAGIGFGLIACMEYRWLWWPWIGISLLFWVNLYKHWWQPQLFDTLRVFHENYGLASQIITPLMIIIIFGYILKKSHEEIR